jgi:hypothetical protein
VTRHNGYRVNLSDLAQLWATRPRFAILTVPMGLANWGYRSSSSNTIIGDVLVSVIGLPYLGQSVKFRLFPPNSWSFGALTLGYNAHPEKLLHAPPAL